jgi:hypothetical protein
MSSKQELQWVGNRFHQLVLDHGIDLQEAMLQAQREWKDFTANSNAVVQGAWCHDFITSFMGIDFGEGESWTEYTIIDDDPKHDHHFFDNFRKWYDYYLKQSRKDWKFEHVYIHNVRWPIIPEEEWQDAIIVEPLQLPEHVEIPEVQERRQSKIT